MFVVFWNDHNPTSCFWDMDVRKATRRNPFFSIPFFFLNKEQKVYFLFCNGIYIPTHKNQIVDTLEIPSLQFAGFKMFQSLVIFFFRRLDLRDHVLFDEFCHFTAIKWKAMLPRWVVWELGGGRLVARLTQESWGSQVQDFLPPSWIR